MGAPIIKSLRKHTDAFLDCHLMVTHPEQWVDDFSKAGASQFTFHIEATLDPRSLIQRIKQTGMKVGIALKPKTPLTSIQGLVPLVDLILIMTVEPGFGGQKMMPDCLEKVKALRLEFPDLNIQVDGGIDVNNIEQVAAAGANVIVSGTGIFGHDSPKEAIALMQKAVSRY